MKCYNCDTINTGGSTKFGINYARCSVCGSVYTTEDIKAVLKTENDHAEARNWQPVNRIRVERLEALINPLIKVLDFGCGEGQFMRELEAHEYKSVGVDQYTQNTLGNVGNGFDAITMIEVIEHLSNPKNVLQALADKLNPRGVIYIETTFADYLPSVNALYVDPTIGHINILSLKALKFIKPFGVSGPYVLNPNVIYFLKT